MSSSAIHKASELAPDVRRALETLLGRPLDAEEHVSLTAYRVAQAPAGESRKRVARRLAERIDKTAKRAERVPDSDLDDAIDEAVDHARHRRS